MAKEKTMFPAKETMTVEFLSGRAPGYHPRIVDTVVGFSNTEGGDLYLGIERDGTVTGANEDQLDIRRLYIHIAENTWPPVLVKTEIVDGTAPVVKVSVKKSPCIIAVSDSRMLRRLPCADGTYGNFPIFPMEVMDQLIIQTKAYDCVHMYDGVDITEDAVYYAIVKFLAGYGGSICKEDFASVMKISREKAESILEGMADKGIMKPVRNGAWVDYFSMF
ncbi:MAG: ATP-binding protein [Clostridia bacterium]|nr:ATP-binding protein [Clostridia bacterium]